MSTSQPKVLVAPGNALSHTPDRDCLASRVTKGISAIMKPLADLIAYFDLIVRNKINRELKKSKASLEIMSSLTRVEYLGL